MKRTYQLKVYMAGRVAQFAVDYPITPAIPRATALFTKMSTLATDMVAQGGNQYFGRGGYRAGAAQRRLLAKELRTALVDIAAMARSLDPDYPGMTEQFRLGRQTDSHQKLLTTAQSFVTAVETPEVKQLFTDRAFPADFDTQLTAKIAALAGAVGRKDTGLQGQKHGTVSMEVLSRDMAKTIRELRALMVKHLRETNPTLLPVWNAAARVYSRSSSAPAPAGPPASPAPAGAGATAGS